MSWSLFCLFFVGIPAVETPSIPSPAVNGGFYENYHQGLRAAEKAGKPMLVILNPGPQTVSTAVTLEGVRKTRERRALLKNYVVVVINAASSHGRVVHRAYGRPKLPHVVILDKRQQYQIFTTSESLYGQRWTEILQTYRRGEEVAPQKSSDYCYT